MGLLDEVMGAFGGKSGGSSSNPIMGAVAGLVASAGGVQGLMSKFESSGMGDKVQSWVGTGDNKAISPDEVKQALGPDEVKRVAEEAGISEDEAADGIAGVLPDLINKVSPDGKLPDMGQLDDVIGGLLKK